MRSYSHAHHKLLLVCIKKLIRRMCFEMFAKYYIEKSLESYISIRELAKLRFEKFLCEVY